MFIFNSPEHQQAISQLNNPKIPVRFVKENGIQVYPYATNPIDPDTVV